jgi:hypothetical protein
MYSLLYTLIIVGILAFLLSIGMVLYIRFNGFPSRTQPGTQNASTPEVTQVSMI